MDDLSAGSATREHLDGIDSGSGEAGILGQPPRRTKPPRYTDLGDPSPRTPVAPGAAMALQWAPTRLHLDHHEGVTVHGDDVQLSLHGLDVAPDEN